MVPLSRERKQLKTLKDENRRKSRHLSKQISNGTAYMKLRQKRNTNGLVHEALVMLKNSPHSFIAFTKSLCNMIFLYTFF